MPTIRVRLLESAARLIAERGIERVNSNQITRAAGVGVGSFYAQFGDKHECHRAVVLYALEELARQIARLPQGARIDEEVRQWVEGVVAFAETRPELFRAAFLAEPRTPPGAPSVGASNRAAERRLDALRQAGAIDPAIHPTLAAKGFAAMMNALVCWWIEDRARAGRDDLIGTLVRLHPAVAAAR